MSVLGTLTYSYSSYSPPCHRGVASPASFCWSSFHACHSCQLEAHSMASLLCSYCGCGTAAYSSREIGVSSTWLRWSSLIARIHFASPGSRPKVTFYEYFWCHRLFCLPAAVVHRCSLGAELGFQCSGLMTGCKNSKSVMVMGSMNLSTLTLDWGQKTFDIDYYRTKRSHLFSLYPKLSFEHQKEW